MDDCYEADSVQAGRYWDDRARDCSAQFDFPLWRRYCDLLHSRWLRSWLGRRTFSKVLKTDLFDEALGNGLADVLASLTFPGGECHGVDVSSVLVAQAQKRHPSLRVHCGDVRCLPLAAEQFDLVISDSTLDHFAHPVELQKALGELHRVMAPGGLLALTLDNPQHPLVALRNRFGGPCMGRSAVMPYFMGHTLGLRQLSEELHKFGFELLCDGHLMHAPRLLALHLSRLLPADGLTAHCFLQSLLAFEGLARLPTARFSGHFVAILARKPTEKLQTHAWHLADLGRTHGAAHHGRHAAVQAGAPHQRFPVCTNDFPFEFIEEHGFKLDQVGLETAMEACASGPGPCR